MRPNQSRNHLGVHARPCVALLLVLVLLLVAACGGDDERTNTDIPLGPEAIFLGSTSLTPDENRQTIIMLNSGQRYEHVRSVHVRVIDLTRSEQPVVWEGAAQSYTDAEGSYWVVYPDFAQPGQYLFEVTVRPTRGNPVTQTLASTVYEQPLGLTIGDTAPRISSFTWDDPARPETITTDNTPNLDFYQLTVADAVTSQQPSVLIFATPGLCTRAICSAVVDSLDPLWADYSDQVHFVHVEKYNLETGKLSPAITAFQLAETPWVYLVDDEGIIVGRWDGVVGSDELRPAMAALLE